MHPGGTSGRLERRKNHADEAVDGRLLPQVLHALAQLLEEALGLLVERVVVVAAPRRDEQIGALTGRAGLTSCFAVEGITQPQPARTDRPRPRGPSPER